MSPCEQVAGEIDAQEARAAGDEEGPGLAHGAGSIPHAAVASRTSRDLWSSRWREPRGGLAPAPPPWYLIVLLACLRPLPLCAARILREQ